MTLSAADFANTSKNFSKVTFVVTPGYQEITPVEAEVIVTIVGNNHTDEYDGNEHSVSGYTATTENALYDVTKDFTFSGTAEAKRTDVGTTNMGLKAEQFENTNPNFSKVTFKVTDGYQTITPAKDNDVNPEPDPDDNGEEMDAEGRNITVIYDGQSHTVSASATKAGSTIEYSIDGGKTWSTTAPSRTNVGTVVYSIRATNPNYETVIKHGYRLTVLPRPITIKADDKTKVYDNDPSTDPALTATVIGAVEGDTANYMLSADPNLTVTAKGAAKADPINYTLSREPGQDVGEYAITVTLGENPNYTITVEDGTFTITPAKDNDVNPEPDPDDNGEEMDAEGRNITVIYDAQPHTVSASATKAGSTIEYSIDGGKTWSTTAPSRTDVGTVVYSIRATNPNYETVVKHGYRLTVLPRPITITADDQTKVVGTEDPEFTVVIEGLIASDGFEPTYTVTRTPGEDVGTYPITPSGAEEQGNYIVTYIPGTLTIVDESEEPVEPVANEFTFFFISDVMLAKEGAHNDAFRTMLEWAASAKNEYKALAVLNSGNLVAQHDDAKAWQFAKDTVNTLPGTLPFLNAAGRTDVNGDDMNYDAYVESDLCATQNKSEDGRVWYRTFDSKQIMVVGIGYQKPAETDEEKERQDAWLAFVNDAIESHRNYVVVLVLNDFVDADGKLTAFGSLVEENVIEANENVELVLSGNASGSAHWTKTYGNRTVDGIMYNYQEDENDGLGFLKIVTFNRDNRSITIKTYSPVTKAESYKDDDRIVIRPAF